MCPPPVVPCLVAHSKTTETSDNASERLLMYFWLQTVESSNGIEPRARDSVFFSLRCRVFSASAFAAVLAKQRGRDRVNTQKKSETPK